MSADSLVPTEKLYYQDQYASRCAARVLAVNDFGVALDRTVAFPEGGGQEGDHGTLTTADGVGTRFVDTRRLFTTALRLDDFPAIGTGGRIFHVLVDADADPAIFVPGMDVVVELDEERRERLTVSHTAAHLVYFGVKAVRPDLVDAIAGCRIGPATCSFSFRTSDRVSPSQLEEISALANELMRSDLAISMVQPHQEHPDARVWVAGDLEVPCGGTHVERSRRVGDLVLTRSSGGRGQEKVKCSVPHGHLALDRYGATR